MKDFSLLPRFVIVLFCLLVAPYGSGEVWSWRNGGTGIFEDTLLPLDWNREGAVAWKTELAEGNGCPILVGDRLFVAEEPTALVCIDSKTGELLWRRDNGLLNLLGLNEEEIAAAEATIAESKRIDREIDRVWYLLERIDRLKLPKEERDKRYGEKLQEYFALGAEKKKLSAENEYGSVVMPATHPSNGYASYTPVSDGERVYACFGMGAVVAYDLEGKRLWHTMLDDAPGILGGSISPLLVEGKLIASVSDYVALDPATGKELWRVESKEHFGTPVVFEVEGLSFLFTSRGDAIRVSDGKKFASDLITSEDRIPSFFNAPTRDEDSLYFVRGNHGLDGTVYRFRIPDSLTEFEENGLELVWEKAIKKTRYYSSPLVHDGVLYIMDDNNRLNGLDSASGEALYVEKLIGFKGVAYASVSVVGDRIYVGSENGQVALIEPGRSFELIGTTETDAYRSTPIFAGDRVFLRTAEDLRAIR